MCVLLLFPSISSCCLVCLWRLSLKMYACVTDMEVGASALCVSAYRNILIQNLSILSIIADQHAYSTSLRMIVFQFTFSVCLFIYSLHSAVSTAEFFSYFKSPYFDSITFSNHFGKNMQWLELKKKNCGNCGDSGSTGSCSNRPHILTRCIAYTIVTATHFEQSKISILRCLICISLLIFCSAFST